MGKLTGKYAIVTGAGRGIGQAIAARFFEDGIAGVAIFEQDKALLDASVARFGEARVFGALCDITDREQVRAAVEGTVARFGRVDILVNNAGITRDAMLHKMRDEDWDSVLTVNLTSMYNVCRCVVPLMRQQAYGRIINLSSSSAFGNAGQSNYAASKAGAMGLTVSLARECGALNITANCIAPGYVESDMLAKVPEKIREDYRTRIPMRRFGDPAEIAAMAAFLASDECAFLTGQCLVINGGLQL